MWVAPIYTADTPTKIYTIFARPIPPKTVSTILKLNSATSPQFKPPTTKRVKAVICKAFIQSPPFGFVSTSSVSTN